MQQSNSKLEETKTGRKIHENTSYLIKNLINFQIL